VALNIHLEDHTGNTTKQAKLSDSATVARLIPALVTALELPITDPSGRPVVYRLSHNSRQLQDDESLVAAGVQNGDTITIVPEMTAGGRAGLRRRASEQPLPMVTLGSMVRESRPQTGFPSFAINAARSRQVGVHLARKALNEIKTHADLHIHHEVGGILLGEVYEEAGNYLVSVEDICAARHTMSSCASLQFTGDTWLDILKDRSTRTQPKTLGWYHSHPGWGIFMSGVDEFTHYSFFGNKPWYVALVIDPLAGELGVFTWEHGRLTSNPEMFAL
jgi:proteasome lid subunit RPN8/RPN11/uncharacterized ubiquitin-like protein YukD